MLDGVAEDSVAFPPEMDKLKSVSSKFPEPPLVLKTASLIVTAIVALFAAKATPVIVGKTLSFSVAVLLLWEVDALLPSASYILSLLGTTVNVSDPLGVPDNGIPSV